MLLSWTGLSLTGVRITVAPGSKLVPARLVILIVLVFTPVPGVILVMVGKAAETIPMRRTRHVKQTYTKRLGPNFMISALGNRSPYE
jgi:hypothetical protein